MEGKLIKLELSEGYRLDDLNGNYIASTLNGKNKLSLKNCEAIANGYDLDELAVLSTKEETTIVGNQKMAQGFIKGFQKALEILGDKKFSEEDVKKTLYLKNGFDKDGFSFYKSDEEIIQSLQQTEWDVEIVMEKCGYCEGCNKAGMLHCAHADSCGFPIETERPKLDVDGCLILIRC
jgi:hypothetical protein